jgi:hypothetical protein
MTLGSIGERAWFSHVQRMVAPDELVVPYNPETTIRSVERLITANKPWFGKLQGLIQESIDIGLFGTTSLEKAVDMVFKEIRDWAKITATFF